MLRLGLILMGITAGHTGETENVMPTEFDTLWLVYLKAGENRTGSEEEAAEIQLAHLAHLKKLIQDGKMHVAGPLEVPPDAETRGICLYRGDLEREEVVKLAENDPAVKAGRLTVEVVKWWVPKGMVRFEGLTY